MFRRYFYTLSFLVSLLFLTFASSSLCWAQYGQPKVDVDAAVKGALDADKWLAHGVQEYNLGHFAQAASSLSMAVSRNPQLDSAHYLLANALWNTRQTSRALQEYQRALETSQSASMTENCKSVLARYHYHTVGSAVHGPADFAAKPAMTDISGMAQGTGSIRGYGAPKIGAISSFTDAAAGSGASNLRNPNSHSDGVAVFNSAPAQNQSFNSWQFKFRMAFERAVTAEMNKRGVIGRCGKYSMIFSCDSGRQLRGKIVDTNAPDVINESLLAATKQLDGSRILEFPPDIGTSGFNFTLAWDNPPVRNPTPTLPPPQVAVDTLIRNHVSVETIPGYTANAKGVRKFYFS